MQLTDQPYQTYQPHQPHQTELMASNWRQNRGMKRLVTLLVVAALAFPAPAFAQAASQTVDVTKLGISLDRIRTELKKVEARETISSENGRLKVHVDVFGQAPPIDFVPDDFSLVYGPVPNSAPTHREHIEHVTPLQYRSPAVPIYGLAVWAAQKLAEKSRKQRCEEEVAAYRAQVMQGIAIAAPRCTQ